VGGLGRRQGGAGSKGISRDMNSVNPVTFDSAPEGQARTSRIGGPGVLVIKRSHGLRGWRKSQRERGRERGNPRRETGRDGQEEKGPLLAGKGSIWRKGSRGLN